MPKQSKISEIMEYFFSFEGQEEDLNVDAANELVDEIISSLMNDYYILKDISEIDLSPPEGDGNEDAEVVILRGFHNLKRSKPCKCTLESDGTITIRCKIATHLVHSYVKYGVPILCWNKILTDIFSLNNWEFDLELCVKDEIVYLEYIKTSSIKKVTFPKVPGLHSYERRLTKMTYKRIYNDYVRSKDGDIYYILSKALLKTIRKYVHNALTSQENS